MTLQCSYLKFINYKTLHSDPTESNVAEIDQQLSPLVPNSVSPSVTGTLGALIQAR